MNREETNMDAYVIDAKQSFEGTIRNLGIGMDKLRTGVANPAMLNGVTCDYYGEKMPIFAKSPVPNPANFTFAPIPAKTSKPSPPESPRRIWG